MTSMFDYDDSVNLAFDAKVAGKKVVTAKHELLSKTGEFFFMAHSERELAQRMQMVEEDIEKVAYHKMANVSDSKAKLVRAVLDEWSLRHASCTMCKTAANAGGNCEGPDGKGGCGNYTTHISVMRPTRGGFRNFQCPDCAKEETPMLGDGQGNTVRPGVGPSTTASKTAGKDGDKHHFGDKAGTCINCKETTGHARGGQWHCPSGAGCQK